MKKYDDATLKKLQQVELEMLHDFVDICEKNDLKYFGFAGTCIGAIRHQGFIPWDDDIDLGFSREEYEKFCEIIEQDYSDKYYILRYETNKAYPLFTARMCKKGTKFREHAMKDVDCPFGIFLDLYAFDNVPDDPWKMKVQAISVWIYSKLLILCSIEKPNLVFASGVKKKIILLVCKIAYNLFKLMHLSTDWIYTRAMKQCTKYNNQNTKRLAFLADAKPYIDMINRDDLYPLQKMQYEDLQLNFPKNMHEMLTAYYGDYMQLPPVEKRYNHCPYELQFEEEYKGKRH